MKSNKELLEKSLKEILSLSSYNKKIIDELDAKNQNKKLQIFLNKKFRDCLEFLENYENKKIDKKSIFYGIEKEYEDEIRNRKYEEDKKILKDNVKFFISIIRKRKPKT